MEAAGSEGEKKKPPEGENKTKRKMKTASQLEILEKTYAEEAYPSEALRAELSVKLGLSDRQLQMWFCHRRLKDRKGPPGKRQPKDSSVGEEMVVGEVGSERALGSASALSPFVESRRVVGRPGVAVARIGSDVAAMSRYYEPQQSIAELRAIAFVEAQLGEPLREDGPILGMEFDPLPPDAFGAPIVVATVGQQKQSGRPFEPELYERPDAKSIKGAGRALHEYQFLPEQPTVRTDAYERVAQSYHYGSPADGPNSRTSSLSSGRSFMHGNEQVPSGYGFQGQVPGLNLLPQQGMQAHLLPSVSVENDTVARKNTFANIRDSHFGAHPITRMENPFISPDRRVTLEEDVSRMERKRKSEEARIAREVEAHEKRIRKELEKQDILRRKREEQMRKEMEKHDRERKKEEERLLREKQREEERYQREQRRELERREKFLQKESVRAEKLRQKEELRREKEVARLKAANERAIARRIAKESMELIEDERLELMELATSCKGLPSIVSLDYETLQDLELYRDMRTVFPPKPVQLKRPFTVQPWCDSEESVGNLLMVWRFLITFADVLGLWPFTLDEFIQAFHDYDSRLLGEIHVSLLRSVIKDIEDVARTPSTGLGAIQNSAANPGGGHPQIVEGAYAWGFDIRNWQLHLNPLTWPEILRQFALSAGFGPQLKRRNIEQTYNRDDNEGNDGEDVISNLRNGAAVENAVAIMQERGFSNPRRSRHRLTPGTVKFAAFHVLSLEGSMGLTILEVAEKIQKSGLRDLTTSKTPEASIAAALSRDSKLFERTAPSTYCVRPPYRKDPADAEAILSAARERIRIFKSGIVDGEDADDAERDGDSESDVGEDPEVDDLGAEINPNKEDHNSEEAIKFSATPVGSGKGSDDFMETPQVGLGNVDEGLSPMQSRVINEDKDTGSLIAQSIDVSGIGNSVAIVNQEDTDIDESNPGEPWVQGLMEGEYSDLSVEERLNALIALIGVAIEGNSIRVVLEERLEAANALKKQMWAEAQLDKRRMKEEFVMKMHFSPFTGNKTEHNLTISLAEGRQSPFPTGNDKNNETSVAPAVQQEQLNDLQNDQNYLSRLPSEDNLQMQDYSAGAENLPYQQAAYIAERSRSQLKSYIGHKAEEMCVYRSLPLGQDRRRNRYWQFITSSSRNDPGCGRIFVELHDGCWRLIDSEEGFDALLSSLDVRGVRESHLHTMLQKIEMSFKESVRRNMHCANMRRHNGDSVKTEAIEMPPGPDCSIGTDSPRSTVCVSDSDMSETSTSFAIELGRNEGEKNDALKRYQDFEKWMWKECFNSSVLCAMKYGKKRCTQLLGTCDYCHDIYSFEDNHCPSCHKTYSSSGSSLNFSEHVSQCEEKPKVGPHCTWCGSLSAPVQIRLLKLLLALVEVSLPPEALQPLWTDSHRKSWGMKLHSLSLAEDLLQIMTSLEGAIKRDYLSSNFESTSELLDYSNPSGRSFGSETVPALPWIPHTTAAVALRFMEFDSSISYILQQKVDSQKDKGSWVIKLPSKYAIGKNSKDDGTAHAPYKDEHLKEENWVDSTIGLTSSGRGRGGRGRARGRTRGGRSERRVIRSRAESRKKSATTNSDRFGQILGWKGRPRGRGGRGRGRRSIRSRQRSAKVVIVDREKESPKEIILEKSPSDLVREEWSGDENMRLQVEDGGNTSSSERSDYDDENGLATGDEFDDNVMDEYAPPYNGRPDNLLQSTYYNVDVEEEEEEDDDDEEDDGGGDDNEGDAEDVQGDVDMEEYINGDSDEEGDGYGDGGGEPKVGQDEAARYTSSDYSE
ncbi:homeobox-DDT domain protein RLT2 isoform X1 [Corylus avellana]|uniref:homeobox-DDT domain protein RLT2 isoform X1 n=1 Tax=Corylus avellana TaxID=13451 RepID=UPI00286BF334|nr:homeobox-DDT domain protein RLT2 isoform X1 [Corylus avellana]